MRVATCIRLGANYLPVIVLAIGMLGMLTAASPIAGWATAFLSLITPPSAFILACRRRLAVAVSTSGEVRIANFVATAVLDARSIIEITNGRFRMGIGEVYVALVDATRQQYPVLAVYRNESECDRLVAAIAGVKGDRLSPMYWN